MQLKNDDSGVSKVIGSKKFFIDSDLMTDAQKETLEKKLLEMGPEKIPEVESMVNSEWQMIFSQKKPTDSLLHYSWPPDRFRELCDAVGGKKNIILIIKGKQNSNF